MDKPYEVLLEIREPGAGCGLMKVCTAEGGEIEKFLTEAPNAMAAACSCNAADFAKACGRKKGCGCVADLWNSGGKGAG